MKPTALIFFASATLASAAPEWVGGLTSPSAGPHPIITPMSVDYQISWKGLVDSGKLHIDFGPKNIKKPGAFVIRSHAVSQGLAAKLYSYHHDFWSEVLPTTLRPRYFHAVETDPKETVTYTIRYDSKQVESESITKNLKSGKSNTKNRTFTFSPVFDLFSAMLHVRSQKLEDGDQIAIVIHPFDTPYLLRTKVVSHEVHEGQKSIRLSVGMNKIDRDSLELKSYKKLKDNATLWLSDDNDRIPLEFRAAVFIGDVRAVLTNKKKF
ncbi:DUF3108 domain-containing protein [Luteolibacter pohnpeiensis]|uniref:DUF3108 domain-containing protein n=1 Tax=Luteolibacter pohnpeiensis TaxID=454153 RepID=A0A934VWK1_9BACT|nr:DUF3108 domain-containing protein [Luteolibacter pohnpeiensis]MBK1882589.1 DUF3108 domain-containing protein [Luteolibacter pohnpeiensis]